MSGLQGGHRDPQNGRYGGGKAGGEHRMHFPAVDAARWDEASAGAVDTDGRWSGAVGERLTYPNTMGQPRGKMMGPVCAGASAADVQNHGSGSTRANTRAAQAYNDDRSTYEGVS